ncbi:hypothetical protein V6N12_006833 [Hibiscus sabdariffa]|uniref:PPPDE domain-containing protein n=1 Tax=Hibiscus sabdariffa TaxID=183260 RepID=A0ABR2EZZ2_9ROSI
MLRVYGVEYAFGAHYYPTRARLREFMERQSASYSGDTNHLIFKNCNHFCEDICCKLTGNQMPKWVHYATAYFQRLKATAVHQDHNFQSDNEKKRLRSAFSCLLSITVLQREMLTCKVCIETTEQSNSLHSNIVLFQTLKLKENLPNRTECRMCKEEKG